MIHGMTAFARFSDQGDWGMATWEIRVVNHRYFDCAVKMPEAFRQIESAIRLQLQQKLHRGRVDCGLRFSRKSDGGQDNLVLNTEVVKKIGAAVDEIKNFLPVAPFDPMKVLSWPDVLQAAEDDLAVAQTFIMQLFEKTLVEVVVVRAREGETLAQAIKDKLHEILVIVDRIKAKAPQVLVFQRQKILKRLEEVMASFEQSRLEQEMVYFAQKVDIMEEIERLEMHVKEVVRVLNEDNNVGKRLDFLMQELNREANTLASKSIDVEITQAAVELKVLIEQMREQVQNIA